MKELIFKNISEFHAYNGMPEPENPLFSASHTIRNADDKKTCEEPNEFIS